jgi:hypothetical protein
MKSMRRRVGWIEGRQLGLFAALLGERSDGTGALRRIRRDKSWSKQQEQDKMQKAALGQSEGSEG